MERKIRGLSTSKEPELWMQKKLASLDKAERKPLERIFLFWKAYRAGDSGIVLKGLVSHSMATWPFVPPDFHQEPDWRAVTRGLIEANSRIENGYWEYPARVTSGMQALWRGSVVTIATAYHAPYGARIVPLPAWWRDENQ